MSYQLTAEDFERFAGQKRRMLEMLAAGPCTNGQLASVALKYTQRIHEIREAGYDIPEPEKLGDGVFLYRLKGEVAPKPARAPEQVDLFKPAELRNF